jgi:hypothetical protein
MRIDIIIAAGVRLLTLFVFEGDLMLSGKGA